MLRLAIPVRSNPFKTSLSIISITFVDTGKQFLRADSSGGQEDLEHMEISHAHLVDDNFWFVDAGERESCAKDSTGPERIEDF